MNDQPSSLPAEDKDLSQIRSSIRFLPEKSETWVLVGDERKPATVVDECLGGIGLMMEMADAGNLQVGDRLIVHHYDCPTPVQIRWIRWNQEVQKIQLGICWSS